MEDRGLEPLTSCMPCCGARVASAGSKRVARSCSRRGSSGGSSSRENDHGEVIGGSVLSTPDSALSSAVALPIKADSFSAALMLIASLPLSDAEKAEAVRRLMAERAGSPDTDTKHGPGTSHGNHGNGAQSQEGVS